MFQLFLVNLIIRDYKRDVKGKATEKCCFSGFLLICVLETTATQGEYRLRWRICQVLSAFADCLGQKSWTLK